jgi:hypothetical protein
MEQIPIHSINTMVSTSATGCPLSYMPDDDDDSSGFHDYNTLAGALLPHTNTENQEKGTSGNRKVYPMDFFTKIGTVHTDRDELIQRWMYRKDCPSQISGSVSESAPFVREVLVQEMVEMRASLSKYAYNVYATAARETANSLGLTLPTCHQNICLKKDLKAAISVLTRTSENELLVYKVFHHRMRTDKAWHISIVDGWASSENIQLMPTNGQCDMKRNRPLATNRQGFGNICLEERKKVLQTFMRVMTKKCGWSIATTNKAKQATKHAQIYTKRVMVDEESGQRNEYPFYVVEPSKNVSCKPTLSVDVKTTLF